MKSRVSISLALVTIAIFFSVLRAHGLREGKAERTRQLEYQAQVKKYSDALKPGTTRRMVEGYLRAQNVTYSSMCCVSTAHKGFSELVLIGHERPPWYCSAKNIYVAFEFDAADPSDYSTRQNAADPLSDVTLFPWLEGCL